MAAQLASVRRRIGPTTDGDSPLLDRVEAQLGEYFAGERRDFDLPTRDARERIPGAGVVGASADPLRQRRSRTASWRTASTQGTPGVPWDAPTGRTGWRSSCRATAWWRPGVGSAATAAGFRRSGSSWISSIPESPRAVRPRAPPGTNGYGSRRGGHAVRTLWLACAPRARRGLDRWAQSVCIAVSPTPCNRVADEPLVRDALEGRAEGVIAAVDVDHLAGRHRCPVAHQEGAHLADGGGIGQRPGERRT